MNKIQPFIARCAEQYGSLSQLTNLTIEGADVDLVNSSFTLEKGRFEKVFLELKR